MEPNHQTDEIEIDLWELFMALRDKLVIIILAAMAGTFLAYLGSTLLITPTYDSSTKIYVLNKQNEESTVTYNDLQSATQLTKDYMQMVKTRPVLEEVISTRGLEDVTYDKLAEKIAVSNNSDGRIITITATDKDPKQAKAVADAVRNAVSDQIVKVMDVKAVNVVEEANLPMDKARPSNMKNAAIGGFLGLFLSCAIVVLMAIMDDRIKTSDDVEKYLGLSVLGTIPIEEKIAKKKNAKNKPNKKPAKNMKKK